MVTLIMIEIYNQKCDTQRVVLLLHSIINYTIIARDSSPKTKFKEARSKKKKKDKLLLLVLKDKDRLLRQNLFARN